MRVTICVAFVAMLLLVNVIATPESPQMDDWFDLQADTITFDFPAPDSIRITAHFTMRSAASRDTLYFSELGAFLDGNLIHTEILDIIVGTHDCRTKDEQNCSGDCVLGTGPGGTTYGECDWYEPLRWPPDSIPAGCFCERKSEKSTTTGYSGEEMVSFELDLTGLIQERYETNNYFALNVATVPTNPSTWGRIKSFYDE